MAVDDDIIMESPYGGVISMQSLSPRSEFQKQNNLTVGITEGDIGQSSGISLVPVN